MGKNGARVMLVEFVLKGRSKEDIERKSAC